jgi:hypothetical protein
MMVRDEVVITSALIPFVDIQIGYAQTMYTFTEPDVETENRDVVLIREGGRRTEQTFAVAVAVGEPDSGIRSATLGGGTFVRTIDDYSIGGGSLIRVIFSPNQENVSLPLTLFPDTLPEGPEAFRATSRPFEGFPNFEFPTSRGAFATTEVLISDNDSKLAME